MQNDLKYELQNVLSGKSQVRFGTIIQTIAGYLKNGEGTSDKIENSKHFKSEEAERLKNFIAQNNLWIKEIDLSQYVSEGAEQRVYLKDSEYVLKLNDCNLLHFLEGKIIFIIYCFTTTFLAILLIN